MIDVRKLLDNLVEQEEQMCIDHFLAPCVRGGMVRTRIAGLVYNFLPRPREFEGWGVFQAIDSKEASVIEEASLPLISEYLRLFKPLRLRLVYALQNQTWLGYPVNESDARQRFGTARPMPVHLVSDGARFEQIVARWDGGSLWFEEIDRKSDPVLTEQLRDALRRTVPTEIVRFQGLTPEMRTVYDLALQQSKEFREKALKGRDENRLRKALRTGGGTLHDFRDRGGYWQVEWMTRDGERHTSAISKKDLTVISAGICLSGHDRDFDLQSLIGVVEGS
jgi:hypothetical protein